MKESYAARFRRNLAQLVARTPELTRQRPAKKGRLVCPVDGEICDGCACGKAACDDAFDENTVVMGRIERTTLYLSNMMG